MKLTVADSRYGGIAQLARAFGSYPKCRRFKSHYRYQRDAGRIFCGFSVSPEFFKNLRLVISSTHMARWSSR